MSNENSVSVAERLKEAMEAKGMKQIDVVNASGIDRGALSCYLSGKYEPKQLAINKLAAVLDVSEMWLWGYDVPKERSQEQKNNDAIADIRGVFIDPQLVHGCMVHPIRMMTYIRKNDRFIC